MSPNFKIHSVTTFCNLRDAAYIVHDHSLKYGECINLFKLCTCIQKSGIRHNDLTLKININIYFKMTWKSLPQECNLGDGCFQFRSNFSYVF